MENCIFDTSALKALIDQKVLASRQRLSRNPELEQTTMFDRPEGKPLNRVLHRDSVEVR